MGTSRTPAEMARKLEKLSTELKGNRKGLEAAAIAAVAAYTSAYKGLVGHRVAGGQVSVRADIKGDRAVVRFVGPAHLVLNPTRPHRISPRRREALTIESDVAEYADHPGTRGRDPGAKRGKAAAIKAVPPEYMEAGIREPLRRIF